MNEEEIIQQKEETSGQEPVENFQSQLSTEEQAAEKKREDALSQIEKLGDQIQKNSKFAQATTLLNGIYGFVEDASTGEKIHLSLTPYEISPRLGDSRLFTVGGGDIPKDPDGKEIASGTEKAALLTAMTVGNRLNAARVVTNFMQEVLPPDEDKRFGSKDQRVGQLSRFLNSKGEEADRGAFLHIVPDVEENGGRIPILYKKYDDKGNLEEKPGLVYVPVNFNFISSKYTLTIKEFFLSSITESTQEIYSLDKTFDGSNLRFFGTQPKIIGLTGILSNFDDDIIGLDDDTVEFLTWNGGDSELTNLMPVPQKGSQRDVFLSYYQNFLAGTKAKDYSIKVYLYFNFKIIEGYMVNMHVTTNGDNDNFVSFNASMIVRREYLAFESGKGLGSSVNPIRNINRGVFGNDDKISVFLESNTYRNNYRQFALKRALESLSLKSQEYKVPQYSELFQESNIKNTNASEFTSSAGGYDESNSLPNEKAWFLSMVSSAVTGIKTMTPPSGVTIHFDEDASVIAADAYAKYFLSNKSITLSKFIDDLIYFEEGKTYYASGNLNGANTLDIKQAAADQMVSDHSNNPIGRGSLLGTMVLSGNLLNSSLALIHKAINNTYYTSFKEEILVYDTPVKAVEAWNAKYDADGNEK